MTKVTLPSTWIRNFAAARDRAVIKARAILSEPVVLGWRDASTNAPKIPGGAAQRWRTQGMANGGKLNIDVGSDYQLIIGEAAEFEAPQSRFTKVKSADGRTYLCATVACTKEDRRHSGEELGNTR